MRYPRKIDTQYIRNYSEGKHISSIHKLNRETNRKSLAEEKNGIGIKSKIIENKPVHEYGEEKNMIYFSQAYCENKAEKN